MLWGVDGKDEPRVELPIRPKPAGQELKYLAQIAREQAAERRREAMGRYLCLIMSFGLFVVWPTVFVWGIVTLIKHWWHQ